MVAAVVAELELGNFSTESKAEELVTQADAHEWNLAEELLDHVVNLREAVRVGRAVGEEYAIRLLFHDLFVARANRHDRDAHVLCGEVSQDVRLDTEIESDDVVLAFSVEFVTVRVGDLARVVLTVEAFPSFCLCDCFSFGHFRVFDVEVSLLGTVGAEVEREGASIDACNASLLLGEHIIMKRFFVQFLGNPVEGVHDNAVQENLAGFGLFKVRSVSANFGRGENHELTGVRRVGQNLLVASHTSIEHGFAYGVFLFAKGVTVEYGSVSQGYKSLALALCFPLKFFVI